MPLFFDVEYRDRPIDKKAGPLRSRSPRRRRDSPGHHRDGGDDRRHRDTRRPSLPLRRLHLAAGTIAASVTMAFFFLPPPPVPIPIQLFDGL